MKEFREYDLLVNTTSIYPDKGANLNYTIHGLTGEAGELANKWKKVIRDDDCVLTEESREAMAKELADVLWYLSACAFELGYTTEDLAKLSAEKLLGRRARGTLGGSGDDR
ncbi:MAG: nucleoside triphosphate pyrophosphohydrolase family protein [Candidatus Thorarchaeota archaeon]|jgi:NTP pyrophosphatase (non-canonical NTP hydrolase)